MRQVLVFAVLILGLALAVDRESASSRHTRLEQVGEHDWVQLFSTARGHAPAAPILGPALSSIHLGRYKILSGAASLRAGADAPALPGLVVAAIDGDAELRASGLYYPGTVAGETARLEAWCAGHPEGTLLVAARRGSMKPAGAGATEELARLEKLWKTLGCEERPWESDTISWAYAARRTSDGWAPAAEAASAFHGVMMTVPVLPADAVPPGASTSGSREGLPLLGRATEKHRIALGLPLKNLAVDAYVLLPGKPRELTWTDLEFGTHSRFSAFVGVSGSAQFASEGVVFRLLVDGVQLASIEVRTPAYERPSWQRWEVDLPEAAAPVELKLIARPLPNSRPAVPQIGAPLLSFDVRAPGRQGRSR